MTIIAIDPGCTHTAWITLSDGMPVLWAKETNEAFIGRLNNGCRIAEACVIEKIESFGMAVGAEVFETVFWSGRFAEAWGRPFHRLSRRDVKLHLCGSCRAKDGNVRCALIDKFGGKDKAIGTKKNPGVLYGIKSDIWSALAVAVTWAETKQEV